ncbi:MAG: binding-protein-dependent transport system inner rane component [Fibrobacteres bacterium]|nr:binding-protein-dependent transport system inner rane component [Fibrobacterota bacterium]
MIQRRVTDSLPTDIDQTSAPALPARAVLSPVTAPPRLRPPSPAFQVRKPISSRANLWLTQGAFLLPLLLWCAVSYLPFLWHPKVNILDPGSVDYFQKGMQVDRAEFRDENRKQIAAGGAPATGVRENPVYLPAPHLVAKALYTAFKTPPLRDGEPWLHESLGHSIRIITLGFLLSALFGVPLGILCGTFALVSRLSEPFVDFIRYMPAPVFGALSVAILGIDDAPKVAIIFVGTFFQMVLVLANTTRSLPAALLEAAQTLGAKRRQLLLNVVVPGVLPLLYRDMRILLGWAWTYLIVAELIGASSGISFFIYQQAKYRNYDNVYAAIIIIGLIGLGTDIALKWLGRFFFPWEKADA